jgi:hypothetical protein
MKKLVALFAVSLSLFAVACGGGQEEAKAPEGGATPAGDTATPPAGTGTDQAAPGGGTDQAAPGGGTTAPADPPKN